MSTRSLTTDFLKECLGDALLRLMQEKPWKKIKIEEITSLAGVGRSMYFRNFASKEEVLLFKYQALWNRWCQTHPLDLTDPYSLKNTRICLQFFYSIRVLNAAVYSAGQQMILLEMIQALCQNAEAETTSSVYTAAFYSHALWGILNTWILRDYSEPIESILRSICHAVPYAVHDSIS